MQRDPSKNIDLNPFQYYIVMNKFKKQLQRCFPSLRIQYQKEDLYLYAKNYQIIDEAEKKIKSMIRGYHVQIIGVQPGFDGNCNQIVYLEQEFHINVFDNDQIKRQFQNFKKRQAHHIIRILKSKMKNNRQSIILIVQNKDLKKVIYQIEQYQKNRNKQIQKLDILSLQLNPKQIIQCFLSQLLNQNNLRNYCVNLITKDNTLAAQGNIHDCKDFKSEIKDQLQRKKTIIINSENEETTQKVLNTSFNYEQKLFSSNQMKRVCQDISKKYNLKQIMNVYEQTKKSKQFFVVVVVPVRHKNNMKENIFNLVDKLKEENIKNKNKQMSNNSIRTQKVCRVNKTSRVKKHIEKQQQPIKKEQVRIVKKQLIISKQIPQKYFDENSLKAYFDDVDCSEEQKINFRQDIRISINKKIVQINLELLPPISTKKKQVFNEYFQSKQFFFVKEVNQKIIQRIVDKLKGNNSDNILTVKFVQGFCPYTYQQIEQSKAKKNDLIKRVKSDGIKQNPRCKQKFYCFVVKGIKTQLIYYSDKMVSDTIIQMEEEEFRSQNWFIKIPQNVHKYMKIAQVQKYLLKYVEKQIKHGSLNLMKIVQSSKNQSMIECGLTLDKSLTLSEMISLKNNFDKIFDGILVQIITQKNIPLQKLSKIFCNSLFVQNSSHNIIQITFIHFNQHSNYFKKKLQKSKRKEVIQFPIELLQCLKNSDVIKFDGKIQIQQDINNSKIILQSYDWIVDVSKQSIHSFIKTQTQNIKKISYTLAKDVFQQLRSQGALNKIFNSFKLTFQTNEIQFSRHRCQLPNGNRIIINILPYQQCLQSFELFFDENLFSLFGFLKDAEKKNGHLINYENKVICVNKKFPLNSLQGIKQKFIMTFNQNHFPYLIQQYNKFKLQDLTIFHNDQTKILNSLNSYSSKNIINIKQYGWIENDKEMPYSDKTQKNINQRNKLQLSFILDQDALDLKDKDKFFVFNKNTNILIYTRNSQTFTLIKDTLKKQYLITLNSVQIPILKNQYDQIQNSRKDQIPVRLALYYLNFENMTQTNLFTNFKRTLYQKQVSSQSKHNTLKLDIKHSKIQYKSSKISFKAHKNWSQLPQLKNEITKSIHRLHEEQINLTLKLNIMSLQNLLNICDEKNVEVKYTQEKDNTLFVTLVGYNIVILKQIFQNYKALENNSFIQSVVPDHWTTQQQQIITVQVDKNSAQFQNIQNKFAIAKIKKLLRIQNQIIWKKYAQQKKDLEYITQSTIKQEFLYHGTRTYNPQNIYKDKQQSFNINFSSDTNLFGRGIYFAAQASYSHSYRYKPNSFRMFGDNNVGQMLYCRVLVGQSQIMFEKDRSKEIKDTKYRDEKKGIKYESIKSVYTDCNNTEVYIIYKSRRAYPQYLIQY